MNDIAQTKRFYISIGFVIADEFNSVEKQRQVILFTGYNIQLEVFHFDNQESNQSIKQDYKKVGFLHFALPVNDLEGLKKRFVQDGINIHEDIRRTSLGVLNFTLLDPSGITVEFFQEE